jgi:hypothetical protein
MAVSDLHTFWMIIEVLDNLSMLDHVMVIGSWAEYLYSIALADQALPAFATRDIDLFIPDIKMPKEKVLLIEELEVIGLLYREDLAGFSKFISPDGFEVEFLNEIPLRKSHRVRIPSTRIVSQSIDNLRIFKEYPLRVATHGHVICVPEPAAYVLQKLIINRYRPEYKQLKDLKAIEYILLKFEAYGYKLTRIDEVFATLSQEDREAVIIASEHLTFNLGSVLHYPN